MCKERGIQTYFALLETVDGRRSGQDANPVVQIARSVGFTVLDLSDFYANLRIEGVSKSLRGTLTRTPKPIA